MELNTSDVKGAPSMRSNKCLMEMNVLYSQSCTCFNYIFQGLVGGDVSHIGIRMQPVDSEYLPQMGSNAGDCEFQREEYSGVADSISSGNDLSRNEG